MDKLGGVSRAHREKKNAYKIFIGILQVGDNLEDQGVVIRTIFEWILEI